METKTFESQILSEVYEEIQQRYVGFDDPAHGWEHIQRVYRLAFSIAERENADSFIVGMAALLHDIGHLSTAKTQHHADLSMLMAGELLTAHNVSASRREAILHAIAAHSFSLGIEPRTLEAKVVRDADRLDSLGAIGILRWAITGTVRRTNDTQTYHPTIHLPNGIHSMIVAICSTTSTPNCSSSITRCPHKPAVPWLSNALLLCTPT